jgi:hypothetical protein
MTLHPTLRPPLAVPLAGFAGIAHFEQLALPVAVHCLAAPAGAVYPVDKVEKLYTITNDQNGPLCPNGVFRAPGRSAVLTPYAGEPTRRGAPSSRLAFFENPNRS